MPGQLFEGVVTWRASGSLGASFGVLRWCTCLLSADSGLCNRTLERRPQSVAARGTPPPSSTLPHEWEANRFSYERFCFAKLLGRLLALSLLAYLERHNTSTAMPRARGLRDKNTGLRPCDRGLHVFVCVGLCFPKTALLS